MYDCQQRGRERRRGRRRLREWAWRRTPQQHRHLQHRGNGIGEALLRAVAGVASDRGCARLQWNVLDWNKGAIAFYERMGARVLTDWWLCRVEGAAPIAALAGR